MEQWWTTNENFFSKQRMSFAGYACITALILRDDDSEKLRERYNQSRLLVCELIEQHRLPSGKGVHIIGDHHAMDNPRNVIVCDSAIQAPMNVCNIAGVTNSAWVRSMVSIRGQYYMFQRVTAPYPPVERSGRGIGFEPGLLIYYVDKGQPVRAQRAEVQKFREVYAKFGVGLVVVVCGSDSDEDANSWWNESNADRGHPFETSVTFRLTYLPREASRYSEGTQEVLQGLIWELTRPGKPRDSVVQNLLNLVWRILTLGGGNWY
ncbi:hypothetical protein AZE42_12442 [Rhizopogon vesiculosus]|uniref:Uncharacterized protein n=1 Tax=Rhizopogon vesiculosus TaxID=180088 RepID=A0A1J8QLX1_9AGAM|nr:hypothetical protein AZE42_12442 [Rhizopogon vesiculosus]